MQTTLKRSHLDDNSSGRSEDAKPEKDTDVNYSHHPDNDLWLTDGNIDIVAEATTFRVHRSVLSTHSELFSDILSIPQPQALCSGTCPVIEATDSADDMRHLLLALYKANKHFRAHQPARVLEDAVDRIKCSYLCNMDDFIDSLDGTYESPELLYLDLQADSLRVLELSRLLGDTSLLRPAYFYLCLPNPDDLRCNAAAFADLPTFREDFTNARACRPALVRLTSEVHQETLAFDSSECYSPYCQETRKGLSEAYQNGHYPPDRVFDRLTVHKFGPLCNTCAEAFKETEERAMRRAWHELPKIFGFKDS